MKFPTQFSVPERSIREGVYRFLLGVIFVGGGNSLGREGPTVHLCAAIASGVGQVFGLARARIQAMVPVGFGAGIAAAFNAPISGITFVFEELLGDFSSKALGGIIIAVVIAATIERLLLGEYPVFNIPLISFTASPWMLVCLPLGVAAGLLGEAFVGTLLFLRGAFRNLRLIPRWAKPALGGLGVGLTATLFYILSDHRLDGLFSIGTGNMMQALEGHLGLHLLAALLVGKFAVTILSYASGGSGGLFSPALFLGAMLGGIFGALINRLGFAFGLPEGQITGACALLGMGALFAAIIRCPLTSLLIIFEMTRNYSLIIPLMGGNMIAYFLALRLRTVPIYDALLVQDRINLRKMPHYQGAQDYRNLPVSTIMTYELVTLRDDLTVRQNTEKLKDSPKHDRYPVLDLQGGLAGLITHQHLLAALLTEAADKPLRTVASLSKVVTVTPETSIREAATRLVLQESELAAVVSREDPPKLLGVVTLHDIARQQNTITEQLGR